MNFHGKTVVVTGGGGGLGQGIVRWLADRKANVVVPEYSDRSDLFSDVDNVTVITGKDLTDEETVVDFYSGLTSLWGSIHLAGGFMAAALLDTSLASLEHMFRMNVVTAFLCSREAVRRMKDGGRIVNVSARPALDNPVAGLSAYTISKGAVASMTRAMAAECLEKDILINAIAPSIIDTPANRQAMPNADFRSWPKPADLAETIGYLVSSENSVTSGTIVPVYGQA
jgi:NAD(P)-dependent dehydrogenase (short-subunit alcohol dehydrogenase family)